MMDLSNSSLRQLCDPELDPLFWRADRIDAKSAWCEHIPFAHWIVSASRPRVLVELGTHTGVSYAAFCLAVERNNLETRCHAIDTWQGDEHAGSYGDQILAELDIYHRRRFSSFSTLMRTTFDEAVSHFIDGTIDLLHIDGLHTYEAVKHDFLTWKPKLSDRAIVLFHDSNERQSDFGVWRLWSELRSQYPSFEFLNGHGLGVLALGKNAPAAVLDLCRLDNSGIARIRNRFALLGERWEADRRERWKQDADEVTFRESAAQQQQLSVELAQQRSRADTAEAALTQAEHQRAAKLDESQELYATVVRAEARARSADKALDEERRKHSRELEKHSRELASWSEQANAAATARLEIERELGRERALRFAIESSSIWRISNSFRAFLASHPTLRRIASRSAKTLVWTAKGQLGSKLAERKQRLADASVIANSSLFDANWYVAEYPDAAASGLPAPLHYAITGVDARNPSPGFDASWYLQQNADVAAARFNPLVHFEKFGKAEGRPARTVQVPPAGTGISNGGESKPAAVTDLLTRHFALLTPLRVFRVVGEPRRVTMVTDSIGPGSLFGGVATSIVFSALLAKHLGAQLRLVTRNDVANPQAFGEILSLNRVEWSDNVDFVHSGPSSGHNVPIGDDEIFVTTSWWTTRAVRQSVHPGKIVYLLQEDERMFYPFGDERLRCLETISDPDIRYVINTKILFDHLTTGPEALPNVAHKGVWFEPAFPSIEQRANSPEPVKGKRRFFFYARPHNQRNLYWRGLEAIQACLEGGILDPDQWEFHFAGKDMHDIVLPHGIRPHFHQNMPWREYVRLVQEMDVGLSLMDTPHPSYPPLDLAAAGAVVVTNRHGRKTSLEQYSANILCVDVSVDGLKQGIAKAITLAADVAAKRDNSGHNNIGRDWSASMSACLSQMFPEPKIVGEIHV